MDNKLIKSKEGFVWLDVTEKALNVFESKLFELYGLSEFSDKIICHKITSIEDLKSASDNSHKICVPIGNIDDAKPSGVLVSTNWIGADKITHEGHVYIRAKDILHV
ncbi:MAG: hypothetical protein [Podoviridae sp. ctrTa16]|nr:MAG: hypothetical protein [Podoviridae sp. ctrTa16]